MSMTSEEEMKALEHAQALLAEFIQALPTTWSVDVMGQLHSFVYVITEEVAARASYDVAEMVLKLALEWFRDTDDSDLEYAK